MSTKLPKSVPYHSEEVWTLIRARKPPKEPPGKPPYPHTTEMCYILAPSRDELWNAVLELRFMGTGHTKKTLQNIGWVARKVTVTENPV